MEKKCFGKKWSEEFRAISEIWSCTADRGTCAYILKGSWWQCFVVAVPSDLKQRCVKFTVVAVICLLLLLLLVGILLAYYCECRLHPNWPAHELYIICRKPLSDEYTFLKQAFCTLFFCFILFFCSFLSSSFLILCAWDAVWGWQLCVGIPVVWRHDGLSCRPGWSQLW